MKTDENRIVSFGFKCRAARKNIEKLRHAVEMAGERGAEWTITPETAVQGYHFIKQTRRSDCLNNRSRGWCYCWRV